MMIRSLDNDIQWTLFNPPQHTLDLDCYLLVFGRKPWTIIRHFGRN